MKRKLWLLLGLAILAILAACSQTSTAPGSGGGSSGDDDTSAAGSASFTLQGNLPDWGGLEGVYILPITDSDYSAAVVPVAEPAPIDSATGGFSLNYYDSEKMSDSGALTKIGDLLDKVCTSDQEWTDPPEDAFVAFQTSFELRDADGNHLGEAYAEGSNKWLAFMYADRATTVKGSCIYTDSDGSEYETSFKENFDIELQAGWNVITSVFEAGDPDKSEDGQFVITGSPITSDPYTLPSGYTWIYDLSGTAPPDEPPAEDIPGFTIEGVLPDWSLTEETYIAPMGGEIVSPPEIPVADPALIDNATGSFSLNYYDGEEMLATRGRFLQLEDFFDAVCASDESWDSPPQPALFVPQDIFSLRAADGTEVGSASIVSVAQDKWVEFWYIDRRETISGSCTYSDPHTTLNLVFDLQLEPGWNAVVVSMSDGDVPDSVDGVIALAGAPIVDGVYAVPSEFSWQYWLSDEPPPDYGDPLTDGYGFIFQGTLGGWDGPEGAQIVPLGDDGFSYPGSPVGYAASIDSSTGDFDISYYDGVEMLDSGALGTLDDFFNAACASGESWVDPPEEAYISLQIDFQIVDADGNEIGSAYIAAPDSTWFEFWYSDREESVVGSCIGYDDLGIDFNVQLQAGWNTLTVVLNDNGTADDTSDDKYIITATPIAGDTYALPSGYTMEYTLSGDVSALGVPGLPAFLRSPTSTLRRPIF